MMHKPKFTPAILALLAAVLFGMSTPLAKLLLGQIDSIILAGLLYLGCGTGAVIFLGLQRLQGKPASNEAHVSMADLPWLAGAIFAGGVAAPIVLLLGLRHTPAATASLLLNFEGVATVAIAAVIFKEAVGKRIGVAMLLVTLASGLLSWDGQGVWGLSLGALGILGACVLWGLDNNFTRNISAKNPLEIVAIKGLGAGAFSLTLGLILGRPLPGASTPWRGSDASTSWLGSGAGQALLAMLLGMACYGLSIYLFILAMRSLGSARTSTLFATAPFIGMLLSFLIYREAPPGLFYASIPLMLAGAWLMLSEAHGHDHVHTSFVHDHNHSHPEAHHLHAHPGGLVREGSHSHWHSHSDMAHSHSHTPDLHHRHNHLP